jgi:hypothetical protein
VKEKDGKIEREDGNHDSLARGMSHPLSIEILVKRNVVWLHGYNSRHLVENRHENIKHLKVGTSERKVAVDKPFNEGGLDEVKQSDNEYFPFDAVKLVLMPAQNDEFFHHNNKAAFQKSDKQRKN